MSRKYANALTGAVGLVSTVAALFVATLVGDGLTISGTTAWVFGSLTVWIVTMLGDGSWGADPPADLPAQPRREAPRRGLTLSVASSRKRATAPRGVPLFRVRPKGLEPPTF